MWDGPVTQTKSFSSTASSLIYEVDAAKDFAARFEIWFVPKDKTKPERKLYEDIYKLPTQHWPR